MLFARARLGSRVSREPRQPQAFPLRSPACLVVWLHAAQRGSNPHDQLKLSGIGSGRQAPRTVWLNKFFTERSVVSLAATYISLSPIR
jgi:hypothetical protein